ncbi:UbiA family prenyltransferase [Nocardioides sp. AX2bis]|uniref:UbiA family prenyltransferase n=1 Tax=Nocardioides sp. AX2bis TaxID=2653157 RepID=UPI0012F457E0|nr:UbiA family prenyltransferase [Nocardioides sp. AX2bis]VXB32158.1 Prenyltransferase [Nocardioides sp. AX2bis]
MPADVPGPHPSAGGTALVSRGYGEVHARAASSRPTGHEEAGTTRVVRTLLGAAHPGPALAVTLLAALLCLPADLSPGRAVLVVLAVLTGQLTIGWSNDLLDLARDRAVGRTDKPLASGALSVPLVRAATTGALLATVVLSLACGLLAGLLHLVVVAAGWAYNLGLKSTAASGVPYAVAFGALPAFVWAAGDAAAPAWVVLAGALLGTGAHLLNAVPDLADDAATGVRGLPHRLGERGSRIGAALLLVLASTVLVAATTTLPSAVRLGALLLAVGLAVVAVRAPGRQGFRAAVGIAVVDVVVLAAAR